MWCVNVFSLKARVVVIIAGAARKDYVLVHFYAFHEADWLVRFGPPTKVRSTEYLSVGRDTKPPLISKSCAPVVNAYGLLSSRMLVVV